MTMPVDLITYLRSKPNLTALVGDRIAMNASAQDEALPRIVIQRVSDDHAHHLTAASGYARTSYQFTCYAASTLDAAAVAEQLRLALDGYQGSMGDMPIGVCNLQDQRDGYDPPTDGDGTGTFNVQQDYLIGHAVSVPTFT